MSYSTYFLQFKLDLHCIAQSQLQPYLLSLDRQHLPAAAIPSSLVSQDAIRSLIPSIGEAAIALFLLFRILESCSLLWRLFGSIII